MSVLLDARAPDGFVVYSHARDDALLCKDYVREKLGLPQWQPNGRRRRPSSSDALQRRLTATLEAQTTQLEKPKGVLTAQYPYRDANGTLLYEVLRYDQPKSFRQRRPDGNGGWIWKLEDRRVVYRRPELLEYPDASVFVTEGEKDCDNVAALGLSATTVAAGRWTPECTAALAGRDCVILRDNDDAGKQKALAAAQALHGTAATIRIVLLPDLPDKGDVTDWLDADSRHNKEKLCEICFATPLWEPTPESIAAAATATTQAKRERRFTFARFDEVKLSTKPSYLIKNIIPREGMVVIWGPPKCGKSFWTLDLFTHVAIGRIYRGHKVRTGAVAYLALEGGGGTKNRLLAWRHQNLNGHQNPVPLHILTVPIDLIADHQELIKEIQLQVEAPVAVVIDTLNRSLRGSENDPKDMANYIRAADAMRDAFGCVVAIIHHCGIDGDRPRGHTSLTGASDVQLAVERDETGNITTTVEYMRDGEAGEVIHSRLQRVELGSDDDGDTISSCAIVPVGEVVAVGQRLKGNVRLVYEALCDAIIEYGKPIPQIPDKNGCPIEAVRTLFFQRKISSSDKPDSKRRALTVPPKP
jgi:hypothetical protein